MKTSELKQAFVLLIEKHQGIIFKVVNMYCKKQSDRDDLFQDILYQLWKSYPSFEHRSKFTTWMYRIALNTAIAQFRKGNKRIDEQVVEELPVNIAEEESYSEKIAKERMVHTAINKLSKAEKAIIILYMDDYSYEEIAEITGLTISNTGVKINRIKAKLQKILNEIEYGI